jgi:hypothetical protein
MKTQKIVPIGRIFSANGNYYLINPQPLHPEWEDDYPFPNAYRFLVVPFMGGNHAMRKYACPREAVFIGDIVVEYATDISAIECELPYDVTDLVTTEIGQ